MRGVILCLAAAPLALAQVPTGTIAGLVTDPSGSAIPNARVTILNQETGLTRAVETQAGGDYSLPALPAGLYRVTSEAEGFKLLSREATVEAGTTTTVNLAMQVGSTAETITVEGAAPQIRYDSHQVGGVVTRSQIEGLPLNGRNFLELAKLEPGTTQSFLRAPNNRQFSPVLGAPGGNDGSRTRVTVDGGSVMGTVTGASQMGLSQEVVQEFQLSAVNFDLATGVTASGAINIVTRSGGNQYHGSGFFFFRDHNLSAYPALRRDPLNPDPFFQRRQSGFQLGGPIRKNRLFFFANLERSNQRGVLTVQPLAPEFAGFGEIAPNPSRGTQLSARIDVRISQNHNAFLRYSHDGSDAFDPSAPATQGTLPSNWVRRPNWTDQGAAALTTVLRPTLVSDLRFFYYFNSSGDRALRPEDCPGRCLGRGLPLINVQGADFVIGASMTAGSVARRYQLSEAMAWQKGSHRLRFGADWEHTGATSWTLSNEPATITLYSPALVRQHNAQAPAASRIPFPASFATVDDILRLPLRGVTVHVGSRIGPALPKSRIWNLWRLYWQDAWAARPRLTLNYGLAWSYERGNFNTGYSKPAWLAPIFGVDGLQPPRNDPNNFSPSAGFAWTATKDNKTVVRGGAGIYYDPHVFGGSIEFEREDLAPLGNGRFNVGGSGIFNLVSGIPGVPSGTPLDFQTVPTLFTGAHLMEALGQIRAGLLEQRGEARRDFSIRNIEAQKQGGPLFTHDFTTSYALHVNLGVQREIAAELVVTADFVYRRFVHVWLANIDYNRFNSVRGPVIPTSTGPIIAHTSSGRARYAGLLVRAEKRLARRTQVLASYALSSDVGLRTGGNVVGFNNDNWFDNFGPLDRDRRHILNVSAVVELPKRLQAGFNSSYYSKLPFTAYLNNFDLNGDGYSTDALPGTKVNRFQRGLGKSDLARLVEEFNRNLAGSRTPRGQLIPRVTLPANYEFGDSYFTQDLRLSRAFAFRERWRLALIGEVFNVFNVANLTGHSGNLRETTNFGQATNRVFQVFGSGGPRSFQLAMRVSF